MPVPPPRGENVTEYDPESGWLYLGSNSGLEHIYIDEDVIDLADVSSDGVINVVDVVLLVNIILGSSDFVSSADLNGDGIANILDVVLLVNVILGS